MGLFSLFRKNKQESASGQGEFLSRSASESATTRSRNSRSDNSRKSSRASKDDGVDPVLPEKKRARRRLIGAVALVLAVVILLPMILDSEPRPLADDIAIQIPSKDSKDSAPTAAATPAAAKDDKLVTADAKEEFVDPATLTPGNDKPAIAPGMAAMPAGPSNVVPAAPAVVEKSEAPKPVAKAEAKPEVKEVKPEPKPATKTSDHKDERKDEHKKDTVKSKTVEKSDKADKSGDNARALAILEGKSTNPDKKPAAAGGKFVIQVAALATQDKIDELRNKLSSAGIKTFTQKVATQAGERTRIRVGPFANREEADKMRVKINKLGLNATIVPA